ncbi:hypothetical protein GWI33_016204 [Rhynchophorus ferrugineus]|uniref:G-protein coupled receptors family 3 profile domain-containing protein n=1 Tax=Rhynchophorus ferrugineus TaxID=354439 RepID=A0A834HXS2_RHYFE|nr:hypothetical protein GWI33_016204 [Rhynchophorus ferrugineus]
MCNEYVVSDIKSHAISVYISHQDKRISAYISGDFIIGALFPLHHQPSTKTQMGSNSEIKCGAIRELYGIQRVEVALQTLDSINNDPKLLPTLTLGMEIRDECWYAPVALRESIELIRESISPGSYQCLAENSISKNYRKGPLIGVIGPGSSSVALQVQNLLQLFHIPQVGYSTTSSDLSDKSRFNYFLRVVPSDYYQAQVILDILKDFGWTYVSVVNTNENYGQSGIQSFRELAEKVGVCIARGKSVLSNAADAAFDEVILDLKKEPNAIVVVCFCEGFTIRGLLKATRRLNMTNEFLFIGSDGWADRGDVTEDYEEEAFGSLSIRIHSPYVDSFDKYYLSLRPDMNSRNPWFNEFWETQFRCKLNSSETDSLINNDETHFVEGSNVIFCTGNESLGNTYRQDPKLSFVQKAIYSFAHALHNMVYDICGQDNIEFCKFDGSVFKKYLMNVSFETQEDTFEFDENGDPPGHYDILIFNRFGDKFDYAQIGDWNNGTLSWIGDLSAPKLKGNNVTSVCSRDCPLGYYKAEQGGKDKRCCWVCVPCTSNQFLSDNKKACRDCPAGYTPNDDKTSCIKLPIDYVRWQDGSAIIAMTFSALGFITALFTILIFLKNNDTPVVKSSTKELSYIILVGMALAHLSIFPMLGEPSRMRCAATRFLPGFSFSMIYSALVTKTNRIARILAGSKRSFPKKKPILMSASAQVVITFCLVFVEMVIAGIMLFYEEPKTDWVHRKNSTLLECQISVGAIVIPFSFDILLVLMCTVYAVKTRNVPENFNEAKFIGFAMYTTCVIWIAFAPIYYGSGAKVITFCMCITLSALVTWIFLFTPKLYIIILRPEKNNRVYFTTTKIRCHIGSSATAAMLDRSSGSWKESSISVTNISAEKCTPKEDIKRTISCQTMKEPLLNTDCKIVEDPLNMNEKMSLGRITESDCCKEPYCQIKNINIHLSQQPTFIL